MSDGFSLQVDVQEDVSGPRVIVDSEGYTRTVGCKSPEADGHDLKISLAVNASWAVNWLLFIVKFYATIVSASKAVLASLVDSVVDLLSQFVLSWAEKRIARPTANYPVGRARLTSLSVIACASIMSMTSIEVIQFSCVDLWDGFQGRIPHIELSTALYFILALAIGLKLVLWIYCKRVNQEKGSDMLVALAEDHLNDVMSNAVAVVTAVVAFNTPWWWFDPLGAILISVVIMYRWFGIIREQVQKVAGHTAPPEFIEEMKKLVTEHDARLTLDCMRIYHFGSRFIAEIEVILPADMTVKESHDIALALQHNIEMNEEIERAHVHVDYSKRDGLEHKVERELTGTRTGTQA